MLASNFKISIILFFISFIFFISCDPHDAKLRSVNNISEDLIICPRTYNSDTLVYKQNGVTIDNGDFIENQVKSKEILTMARKGSWDDYFSNDKVIVLLVFFKKDILKKRSETETPSDYDIKQIIYVSKYFLEKNNWTVVINSVNNRIIRL